MLWIGLRSVILSFSGHTRLIFEHFEIIGILYGACLSEFSCTSQWSR